jgi:putative oxidoreductase
MTITNIFFWVLIAVFIAPSLYFGYIKMVAKSDKIKQFTNWGFPQWFMRGLGLTEILASVSLIFPETRFYGMGVWVIILVGAIYINIRYKEKDLPAALIVSVQLIAIYSLTFFI